MEVGFDPFALAKPGEKLTRKQLLRRKLRLMRCSNSVYSLLEAARAGDADTTRARLAEGANLHEKDELGNMPLHLAVQGKSPQVVQLLLDAGADPQVKDGQGRTALELCQAPEMRGLMQAALARREREIEADTMIQRENVDGLRRALAGGLNPNAASADNMGTLLLTAAGTGNAEMIGLLLKAGAKADAVHRQSRAGALHYAARRGGRKAIRLLLWAGAKPGQKASQGAAFALHEAIWHRNLEAVKTLLPSYAAENFSPWDDIHGYAINMAVYLGGDKYVAAFVKAGLNPNDPRFNKLPPHVQAAKRGHVKSVKMLLKAGADRNARDSFGKTVADYMPSLR